MAYPPLEEVKNCGSITHSRLYSCCHCGQLCVRVFVGAYPGLYLTDWCADCFVCFGVVCGSVLLLLFLVSMNLLLNFLRVCCICCACARQVAIW